MATSTSSRSESFDVIVVGAGVALVTRGRRVAMLHRDRRVCALETVSPFAASYLDRFRISVGTPLPEVVAWWGHGGPTRSVYPGARIVERSRLADAVRERAQQMGAMIMAVAPPQQIHHDASGWTIDFTSSRTGQRESWTAAAIAIGTGRTSNTRRLVAARRIAFDELYSVSIAMDGCRAAGTWTESCEDGWWNLTSTAYRSTLSFFSDADGTRRFRRDPLQYFDRLGPLRTVIDSTPSFEVMTTKACGSSMLVPCAGPGWVAVGDAASTLQPLASAGITKALEDARAVSAALIDSHRYRRARRKTFEEYLQHLGREYAREDRWLNSPFWRRRCAASP